MNPFQSIPPKVRTALYLLYGLAGLVLGICPILDVHELWGVSVVRLGAALAYVGIAFGFTAAANVTETTSVVDVPAAAVPVVGVPDPDVQPEDVGLDELPDDTPPQA